MAERARLALSQLPQRRHAAPHGLRVDARRLHLLPRSRWPLAGVDRNAARRTAPRPGSHLVGGLAEGHLRSSSKPVAPSSYASTTMMSAGFHEIVLVVKDVQKSVRFYRDVVGLILRGEPTADWASFATISLEHPQWLGLRSGDLLFEEHSPRPKGQRFGPVHFALEARDPT